MGPRRISISGDRKKKQEINNRGEGARTQEGLLPHSTSLKGGEGASKDPGIRPLRKVAVGETKRAFSGSSAFADHTTVLSDIEIKMEKEAPAAMDEGITVKMSETAVLLVGRSPLRRVKR